MDKCPTCMRPYKKLTNEQRARSNVGTGHEKQVAKSLGDMGNACKKVHELLKFRSETISGHGWVSRDRLSRELRDEFGVPIEIEMRKNENGTRQAYYRLARPKTLFEILGNYEG